MILVLVLVELKAKAKAKIRKFEKTTTAYNKKHMEIIA
jgi:hypothetical protein